ncbi:HEPN domain-containing protein [Microbacterium laevaniformans]|uniref:HEPN domain-containing protein n=1 Tax=Microbacterium laevaniformans TaxID=36807 RepID=UPI003D99AF61
MHRREWQMMSRARLDEARSLLSASQWSGAYYLAGYAVEFGLKAVLAKQFQSATIPNKKLVLDIHTHNLDALVKLAGLKQILDVEVAANPSFELNWSVAKDWSEASRYAAWTSQEAADMVNAVGNRSNGVMKWVTRQW